MFLMVYLTIANTAPLTVSYVAALFSRMASEHSSRPQAGKRPSLL